MPTVSFQKITTGEFDVLLDGQPTGHHIVNGSKGTSGHGPNMYGIIKPPGTVRWIGTLQACKKILTFTLTKKNPAAYTVHNPATGLQPIELITDRAKRYRAQQANQQTERRCIYCGQEAGRLDVEHINGREADNAPENLAYACRPCNTAKGAHFAKHGIGEKTAQFNPTKKGGAANLHEWEEAIGAIIPRKGAKYAGSNYGAGSGLFTTAEAVALIRATPAAKRSEFGSKIWGKRYARGTAGKEPIPF